MTEEGIVQGRKVGQLVVRKVVTRLDEGKTKETAASGDAGASADHSDH